MTRLELINQIVAHVQQQGSSYVESSSDQIALLNRALQEVSHAGRLFQSDDIRFNVISGTSRYNYDKASASFTLDGVQVGIVELRTIYMKPIGVNALHPMLDFDGKPGKVTIGDLASHHPNYVDLAAFGSSQPAHWYFTAPSTLNIWPAPAETTEWRVDAYYYHPSLTTDSSELLLPDALEREFILYCASQFIYANASGESRKVAEDYLVLSLQRFKDYGAELRSQLEAGGTRGRKSGVRIWGLS